MAEAQPRELSERRTLTDRACAALVSGLANLLFRPSVVGVENIPLQGPVLIAPIHRSNVDFASRSSSRSARSSSWPRTHCFACRCSVR